MSVLRLGTRRSPLALAQSRLVAAAITQSTGRTVELVEIVTHGDTNLQPLAQIGGTGVFVSALRDALADGRVDLAVHSLKDLPTAAAEGLVLAAIPKRADPRDALVARDGLTVDRLPDGAQIGTGSPRRAAQLVALDRGFEIVDVRGNVDTRIGQVTGGSVDAVVLAVAGLERLGRTAAITEVFEPSFMLPAPGQGALAIECRTDHADVLAAVHVLEDPATRCAVTAERAVLSRLEAGCSSPVGALAIVVEHGFHEPEIELHAVLGSLRLSGAGSPAQAVQVGYALADRLLVEAALGALGERVQ